MNTIYAIIKEDTATASCNVSVLYLSREDAINEILSYTTDIIDDIFKLINAGAYHEDWGWNLATHIRKYTTIQLAELEFYGGTRCEIYGDPDITNEIDFYDIPEVAQYITERQSDFQRTHKEPAHVMPFTKKFYTPFVPNDWRPCDAP